MESTHGLLWWRPLQRRMNRMQEKMERMQERARTGRAVGPRALIARRPAAIAPSMTIATRRCAGSKKSSAIFDFLDRLRHAKDKAEFDQFMRARPARQRPKTARTLSPPPKLSTP